MTTANPITVTMPGVVHLYLVEVSLTEAGDSYPPAWHTAKAKVYDARTRRAGYGYRATVDLTADELREMLIGVEFYTEAIECMTAEERGGVNPATFRRWCDAQRATLTEGGER